MDMIQKLVSDFKKNGTIGPDLYYLLLNVPKTQSPLLMTPSVYAKEVGLSCKERLKKPVVLPSKSKSPLLSLTPQMLIFQNCTLNEEYTYLIVVRNISQLLVKIGLHIEESSNFLIKPSGVLTSRLAPGMALSLQVTFIQDFHKDYIHDVKIITDIEEYEIPLIGIGPRPIYNFPDQVEIPPTPIKTKKSKTIYIRNIGTISSNCILSTDLPFFVSPDSIYTTQNEVQELTISFKSMNVGEFHGSLIAAFESGEMIEIKLKAMATSIEVFVDKKCLRFEDTFNTLVRQMSIKITNNSDEKLPFMCVQYKSIEEDYKMKFKFANAYRTLAEIESIRGRPLVEYDLVSHEQHAKIYNRILDDELQTLTSEKFLFKDIHFSIAPLKGYIWERNTTEIVITFYPKEIGSYEATIYLDISGVEGRIPIKVKGVSLPPEIKLNVETLDVGKPYVNQEYKYEIVAMNRGHINGIIRYKATPTLFGSLLRCEPVCLHLNSQENKMFIITFQNPNQGPFFEELFYEIIDTDVVLKLCFKGETVYPVLVFDPLSLDFGKVEFGVPKKMTLSVFNEATVEVNVSLRVMSDGPEENSISLEDYVVSESPKPLIPKWPKEFQIEPSKFCLSQHSMGTFNVTIIANITRTNSCFLSIDMVDCDSPEFQVPIKYEVVHPQIKHPGLYSVRTKTCFINCPYIQEITFSCNVNTHFVAELYQDPSIEDANKEIQCTFTPIEGSTKEDVPIKLQFEVVVFEAGRHLGQIRLHVFGCSHPIPICDIILMGQPPIVTYAPPHLAWGQVKLLKTAEKRLTLYNDTPIPVEYTSFFLRNDGKFVVDKPTGIIESESLVELVLSIFLRDVETVTDKYIVQVQHLKDIVIPLSATGTGTSIVVGELVDRIALGKHFTKLPMSADIVMKNEGTKNHTLEWIYNYKLPKGVKVTSPFFQLTPSGQWKMSANEEVTLNIRCTSSKACEIVETWHLIGSVEGLNKKECLLECPISIVFLDPKIEVSHTEIDLRYDYGPFNEYYKLTDYFTVKNVSQLPLTMDISVSLPFQLIQQKSGYKFDENDPNLCECLCYNINDEDDIPNDHDELKPKRYVDFVTKRPVAPIRKTKLDFFQDIHRMKSKFQLVSAVSQELEDGELMRVQVVFDVTRYKSFKTKIFCDLIHLGFKRFRNKDCIKIVGRINFPNLNVQPPLIDFECIPNYTHSCKFLLLENNTPVTVCYQLSWKSCELTSTSELSFSPANPYLYDKVTAEDSLSLFTSDTPSYQCPAPSTNQSKITGLSLSEAPTNASLVDPSSAGNVSVPALSTASVQIADSEAYKRVLYSILSMPESEPYTIRWAKKYLSYSKSGESCSCSNIIELIPHRGLIKAGETQVINIVFSPNPCVDIKAKIECQVLGGPSEIITVCGKSSDMNYLLSTDRLNYKIRLFNEKAKESIYLMNTTQLPFEVSAIVTDKPKCSRRKNECSAEILDITPMHKYLGPGEEVEITVTVNPGIMGNFELGFFLVIGHFDQIPISVIGCGVIPQIYLSFRRAQLDVELSYRAIATLTQQFIEAVVELISISKKNGQDNDETEKIDLDKEWHVCSKKDNYPSLMDIDLALERLLVVDYLSNHPDVLKNFAEKRVTSIPHFVAPPYIVDFGVVVTGSTVSCSAEVINYSPVPTKPKIKKSSNLPEWLDVKMCGKIVPGFSGLMEITFNPSIETFSPTESQHVEQQFIVEVPSGVVIPVIMRAICATPCLTSHTKMIDFGIVRCGNKITCSVPVKNNGLCPCVWYASLQYNVKSGLPITLLNTSGNYEAGEGGWIEMVFKPDVEANYQAVLVFNIYMNPNQLRIPIRGRSVAPKVKVIGADINFPPTLPRTLAGDLFFGVTNPCLFPIEVVIPDKDSTFLEDRAIYELLNEYYKKPDEMLIPKVVAGERFPESVMQCFENFKEFYKTSLRGEIQKAKEISKISMKPAGGKGASKQTDRKSKRGSVAVPKTPSTYKIKSQAEIMQEYMEHMERADVDPLDQARKGADPSDQVQRKRSGIIIGMYSSPLAEAETYELAYILGKKFRLPVINIDELIFEELTKNMYHTDQAILNYIEEAYQNLIKPTGRKSSLQGMSYAGGDTTIMEEDNEAQLWRKIVACGNYKPTAINPKASSRKPSLLHNVSRIDIDPGISYIPFSYLQETIARILSDPKYDRGFIVNSLSSHFMKSPSALFQNVLKSKPHVKAAQIIISHSDLQAWIQNCEKKEDLSAEDVGELAEITSESEIERIIALVHHMDADEYESVSKEYLNIYIIHYLNERVKTAKGKLDVAVRRASGLGVNRSRILSSTSSKKIFIIEPKNKEKEDKSDKKSEVKSVSKKQDNTEFLAMSSKYVDYQKNFESILSFVNYWNMEQMDLSKPFSSSEISKKNIKAKKVTNPPLIDTEVEPAFPVTILTGDPLQFKDALIHLMNSDTYYVEALNPPKEVDILSLGVKMKEFTILMPTLAPICEHDNAFVWEELVEPPLRFCACEPKDLKEDGTQARVREILDAWHCICGKALEKELELSGGRTIKSLLTTTDSKTSDILMTPQSLLSAPTEPVKRGRHILNPGDLLRYKYTFYPTCEGSFKASNYIEVVGWPDSRIALTATGICDLPRLDTRPKKMYPNFTRRSEESGIYNFVYLDDQNVFDCGVYFISNNRIYEEETNVKMHNVSLIPANLKFTFAHDDDCFRLSQDTLFLPPGGEGFLNIKVAPKTEVASNTIICKIKDNPTPVRIPLICHGVMPSLEVLPIHKSLDFGKLLLYRCGKQKFVIKNDSVLPIFWRLKDKSNLGEEFEISDESGVIDRDSNQIITVTYFARVVEIIQNRNFSIEIFDEKGRGDSLMCEELSLSAECYDVMVECTFDNPEDDGLNYGSVKVNSHLSKTMHLLNRGKYSIFYKLKKVKGFPEPKLLKSMSASPNKGILPPTLNMVPVEFTCTPRTQMELKDVPAFTCMLLDGSNSQVVVAEFPIHISLASFYNTFTIHPLGALDFSVVPVGSTVTKVVLLTNTSPCPITYEIEVPAQYREPIPSDVTLKQSRSIVKIASEIKCGNFTITEAENFLPPGRERKLKVSFFASHPKAYHEEIKFIINDTCPAEVNGVPFTLLGRGAMPSLDFWNVDSTFREHLIVRQLADYNIKEGKPHCIFVEGTATLHFFCVPIFKQHKATIDLLNNGSVFDAIQVNVTTQSNTGREIFTTDKQDIHIEPLEHAGLSVTFAPKALEEYRAVLEVKLKIMPNHWQTFKVCLIGEGVLPRIQMLQPRFGQKKTINVSFPITFVNSTSKHMISMKSISPVLVKVAISVDESNDTFALRYPDGEECFHFIETTLKPQDYDEAFELELCFNPLSKGAFRGEVLIKIADNPYEQYTIIGEGESYIEDVILNHLRLLSFDYPVEIPVMKRGKSETEADSLIQEPQVLDDKKSPKKAKPSISGKLSKFEILETPLKYKLNLDPLPSPPIPEVSTRSSRQSSPLGDYHSSTTRRRTLVERNRTNTGGLVVDKIHKRNIVMSNCSSKLYKFEWFDTDNVKMAPNVGLISPGQEKDVVLHFYSPRARDFKELVMVCYLTPAIENQSMETKGCIWDSRQVYTKFTQISGTNIQIRVESFSPRPANKLSLEFAKDVKVIALLLWANIEYAIFDTDLEDDIDFGKTLMFKKKEYSFNVMNLGQVELNLSWSFSFDCNYPRKKANQQSTSVSHSSDSTITELGEEESKTTVVSTLFSENSDSSSIERESADTFFESELPFTITPQKCSLKYGGTQMFTVAFTPTTTFHYNAQLKSNIENLHPKLENILVTVEGECTLPYCHFDIEESDYLKSGRRSLTLPSLPPRKKYTVMEFNVLGTGCYKKFVKILNPTKEAYNFIIELESPKSEFVPTHFDPLSGTIEAGSSKEITLTFSPACHGVYESEWLFKIRQHSVTADLFVVGIVRDPNITFVPTILVMDETLVGSIVTKELVLCNNEIEPINFKFRCSTIVDDTGKRPVTVVPDKGTMMPMSQFPLQLSFRPLQSGDAAFKVLFDIQHMSEPLALPVMAHSEHINPVVEYFMQSHKHLLREDANTNIHFDETANHYKREMIFTILNNGSIPFDYRWEYNTSQVKKYLEVSFEPECGTVDVAEEITSVLSLVCHGIPVVAFPINLIIKDGPTYNVFLHADIEEPIFRFNFMEHDFGTCIVNPPDFDYKKTIQFKNNDYTPLHLDLTFTNVPELMVDYKRQDAAIMPHQMVKIPVYFRPKEVKKYEFTLPFYINTLCERVIKFKGEGVPLLFDLYEGCDKTVDFGIVMVGKRVTREFYVINQSRIQFNATLFIEECVKDDDANDEPDEASECLTPTESLARTTKEPSRVKQLKRYKRDVEKESLETDIKLCFQSLKIEPSDVVLKPNEKKLIKIIFQPTDLIENIRMQVCMKACNRTKPIVLLKGSATGMCLHFSQESLQFGMVRIHGRKRIKILLINKGDIETRYRFQQVRNECFSISPMEGLIAAKSNVTFVVTFHPTYKNPFIKSVLKCSIENYRALSLDAYGSCLDLSDYDVKAANFKCPVRESDTIHININNPTDGVWNVIPFLIGKEFEVVKEFTVEPKTTYDLAVKYAPKLMGDHRGQLLLSPLGENSLFFNLIGRSLNPSPNAMYELSIACKQPFTEKLEVKSLVQGPQTYQTRAEILKITPDNFKGYYDIKMPRLMKVWGESTAICDFTITCYSECVIRMKVSFINMDTREFQYYLLVINVGPSPVEESLEMVVKARETVEKAVTVRNPLVQPAKFSAYCANLDVIVPEEIVVNERSEEKVTVKYSPFVAGEQIDYLEIGNPTIGVYLYKLRLKCLPPVVKKLTYHTSLGCRIPMYFKLTNRVNKPVDFVCLVTNSSFIGDKVYPIPALERKKLTVYYEPVDLGEHIGTVTFDSPLAGEYSYEIKATCTVPKPRGPVDVRLGGSAILTFKNVFDDIRTFRLFTDNPAFTVKNNFETIKPKQELKIQVNLASSVSQESPPKGSLTIECFQPAEPQVSWTYFLQGTR